MILKSQRIYLRPIQKADAQSFLDNTKDEEIRYYDWNKRFFYFKTNPTAYWKL